ncbi:peptidoglycan bridge formation glycyltransferase FemA/FemB family protein [Kineosporia sp. NBRC 101677]|uniref:lipid II:glycine glycyltransferase FemX n=1 Tax=Kineosporia sp. NBRC 101677 TaxID=3032197 RepID=UPI0025530E2F|nr:peptidoglycan bridge formation glycyltransferase FemA/FemB family protein [Kineosporia sp. NBRC 101677]
MPGTDLRGTPTGLLRGRPAHTLRLRPEAASALWPKSRTGLVVQAIDARQHARYAESHSASILQTPAWAGAKPSWRSESIGWIEQGELVGAALVLHRPVPGTNRSLAYVPEGPALPWHQVVREPARWLDPFLAHLRSQHAFAVRIGPAQAVRTWSTATAKRGLAAPGARRFSDLEPDQVHPEGTALLEVLREKGWTSLEDESGHFSAGQPRLGVRLDLRGQTPQDLLKGMNQQWRRNVKRSAAAGVRVRPGSEADLAVFHRLYVETAERDGFTPRPLSYFRTMGDALGPVLRLWVGELEGEALAAAITVDADRTCWYTYGGSTSLNRDAQASTAVQWAAMRAALARDCWVYDLRGIADTLDEAEKLSGLLRFKLGTGGSVVETAGEWEFVLSPLWHKAFQAHQRIQKARS